MTEAPKPKVLWLTNLPAPYRFPIWEHLSKSVDLTVIFVLKKKNWRNWPAPEQSNWNYEFLSLNSLQIKEYDIIPSARGARRILKGVDFAIIGGWEAPIYIYAILLAKKFKIPVIQFYESLAESHRFESGPVAMVRKWILKKADKSITISDRSTQALIGMGINSSTITTLFNPMDVNWYYEYAKSHRQPPALGHRFLFAGRLIESKNILAAIRAFASIAQSNDSFIIAGQGPLESQIKELITECGLQDKAIMVGHKNREQLADLYSKSHTLVLPSTREVWGLVVNEGLATGSHAIVSKAAGVLDLVEKMKGVYKCTPDKKSIAQAMQQSRQEYIEPIKDPEILQFSAERFASEVAKIIHHLNQISRT